jgi:hypothetical protein
MKNVINELRSQPLWVRELMFALFLVITVSSAGLMAFNSSETKLYALIHPEEVEYQRAYAEQREKTIDESGSLFANIGQFFGSALDTVGGLGASIGSLFAKGLNFDFGSESDTKEESLEGTTYQLPLSKDR